MEIKHSTHKMGQKLLVGQYNESWQLTQHMHSESTFESPDVNSNFKMKKLWPASQKQTHLEFSWLHPTPIILPPSACQKGPWSLPRICLPFESTVIRKNIPDVRLQLTLYPCLLIQRKCQPSQQMLRLS